MVGPFRAGLLHARRELAHVRLHRGDYTEAVDELRAIATECHQRWGDTSLQTLLARSILAEALTVAGHADEAVTLSQQVIDCSDRVPGIGTQQTAYVHIALADALLRAGKLDDAERELASIAPAYEAREADTETILMFGSTLAAAATPSKP